MKSFFTLLAFIWFCTTAHAEHPIKNVTITTPDDHSQPLPPAKAPIIAGPSSENADTWSRPTVRQVTNLHKGRWLTGLSLSMTQAWFNGADYFSIALMSSLQHFFTDRFAFGGAFQIDHYSNTTHVFFGPAATYYFYAEERVATYVNADLLYKAYDRSADALNAQAGIGVRYFVTPAVALGPEIYYKHSFGFEYLSDYNEIGVLASFALHL